MANITCTSNVTESPENGPGQEQQLPEEHGLSAAQIRELGVDYAEARNGKPLDEQRAIQLYIKAAEMGDIKAQRWMGRRYRQGRGVPKDEQWAHAYFSAAASQGDKAAAEALRQ